MDLSSHHYAVTVSETEPMLAFYRDVLGLDVVEEFSLDSENFHTAVGVDAACEITFLQASDGSLVELLEYDPVGENINEGVSSNNIGASHLCFEVDDVEAANEELPDDVGRVSEPTPIGERTLVYVHDPEGNVIELIQESDDPIGS